MEIFGCVLESCVVHPLGCCLTTLLARGNPVWLTRELGILLFRTFCSDLDRDRMCGITLAGLAWFNLRL